MTLRNYLEIHFNYFFRKLKKIYKKQGLWICFDENDDDCIYISIGVATNEYEDTFCDWLFISLDKDWDELKDEIEIEIKKYFKKDYNIMLEGLN